MRQPAASRPAALIMVMLITAPLYAQVPAPRVGVAFGGGSARGIAHIGVIQWLEEHHVPIDVAAGTSMGGLVGGAFATGMSAAELRTLITGTTGTRCSAVPRSASRISGGRKTRATIPRASSSG